MANLSVYVPAAGSSVEDRWGIPTPPGYLTVEGPCHCAAFAPLTQPTWRVLRQSTGEYHAYGDSGRLYVGHLPDACKAEGLWHIEARSAPEQPPDWYMDFDFHTPTELIKAVTVLLAEDAKSVAEPRPYLLSKRHDDMGRVWQPLVDAGWRLTFDEACYLASSPDGVASLTYMPPRKRLHTLLGPEAWLFEVVPNPELDPLWCAMFHDDTPLHLVAAFTIALADLTPMTKEKMSRPPA